MGVILPISKVNPEFLETLDFCPYCKDPEYNALLTEDGYPHVECKSCKLIYLKIRLKEKNLDILYDSQNYHEGVISSYHYIIGRKRLELFKELPQHARIHEDGAGIGNFVAEAKRLGHNATGSDFGEDAVKKAKNLCGVDLIQGALSEIGIETCSLDAFAAFNLFSHLYEPWNYIKEVAGFLKPGGQFLTRGCNHVGYFKEFCPGRWGAPEHVYHFNLPLLRKFYEDAGLKIVKAVPAFDSDFPYLFYNTSKNSKGAKKWLSAKICQTAIRAWNTLRLPKDDIYILAKKS